MTNIELDTLMRRKNKEGDIETHYPITRAENVLGLDEKIQEINNSEQTKEQIENISEGLENLKVKLDEKVSSRAPAETALSNEVWTEVRAEKLDEKVSSRAPAETALSNEVWTEVRAEKLDEKVSSRAPAETALSNEIWTEERAKGLDLLENEVYGLAAIKNGVEMATNNVNSILTSINELYASQNSAYVASTTPAESYSSTVTTISFSPDLNSSSYNNSGARTRFIAEFIPKFNGTIALKFKGTLSMYAAAEETTRGCTIRALLYENKYFINSSSFTQYTNTSSSPVTLDNYERRILDTVGNTGYVHKEKTNVTVNLDTNWINLSVEKGKSIILALEFSGSHTYSETTKTTFTASNMLVQLGYDIKVV